MNAQPNPCATSTFPRRPVLGLSATAVLILHDRKPDYADVAAALGGRVIKLSPNRGRLNVLDVGPPEKAARRPGGAYVRQWPALTRSAHSS